MSSDEKVLDFPRVEVTSEENARRVMVEATRRGGLAASGRLLGATGPRIESDLRAFSVPKNYFVWGCFPKN